MSVRGLALHAQRIGMLFASPATWGRLIQGRGWLRLRARVHPATPKEGVRATEPNEYSHIDVTVIRLLDGTRLYLHAVIDNFSRGQTPDEMYFGTGAAIPEQLAVARRLARDARLDRNRSLHCRSCIPDSSPPISPPDPASPVISSLLQMHAPNSGMS
jgi:hypothetical protein